MALSRFTYTLSYYIEKVDVIGRFLGTTDLTKIREETQRRTGLKLTPQCMSKNDLFPRDLALIVCEYSCSADDFNRPLPHGRVDEYDEGVLITEFMRDGWKIVEQKIFPVFPFLADRPEAKDLLALNIRYQRQEKPRLLYDALARKFTLH